MRRPFLLSRRRTLLIPIERFTAATGGPLDSAEQAKAQIIIEDVSALVKAFCGRDFALHTNETVTLHTEGLSRLIPWPHSIRPVHSVQAVTADGLPYTAYEVRSSGLALMGDYVPAVQATLTYGYAEVPGEVAAVTLTEALYRFGSEPGVSQEQIGDLVTDYGLFQPTLSRDSRRLLRRYRRSIRTVRL